MTSKHNNAATASNLTIRHLGGATDKVDPRTIAERWAHYATASWFNHTQTWAWDGGDAIVVPTEHDGEYRSHAVIRRGDAVVVADVTHGGIAGWFASYGITTTVHAPTLEGCLAAY
jgi:hypothetical protein